MPDGLPAASLVRRAMAAGRASARAALWLVYPPTCIACQAATGEAHTLSAAC